MEVATKDSLSQSLDRVVKHYASLFKLPSYRRVVLLQALICVCGGLVTALILFPSGEGLANGLFLGVSLFTASLILDHVVSKFVLRRDAIYNLRRTGVLSLACLGLWLFFILVGNVVALFTHDLAWWIRLCLLGYSAMLILRLVVFNASSDARYEKRVAASLVQPLVCIVPFIVVWTRIGYAPTIPMFLYLICSLVVGVVSSHIFLYFIDKVGKVSLGISSMSLFKAFLLTWIVNLNAPFEEFLEQLGEEQNVEFSLIKFESSKTKAVVAVPSVHPGPFKNIGSSILPSLLKNAIEKEFDCVACVPHGLFGHELDLASQLQNQLVIRHVVEAMNFEASGAKASPFVTVTNGLAVACCQIFGDFAFLSVTLAPNTTEDFPQELGMFVRKEAGKQGLACCVVVNAHNSIDGLNGMPEALDSLKNVATTCLERAVSQKQSSFQVGAATVSPRDFSLGDGMGDGGITVIVVKVGKQRTAYVVIDGNNMVSGLREKILSVLHSFGVDAGEVYTTDTHSVSALILGRRGYHPIGEAIPHDKLIGYIEEATHSALSNLERVRAGCCSVNVSGAKVIGKERLESLSLLIDKGLQRAKKVVAPVFVLSGLLLMLFLLFI
jgi:putative membrane protein